MLLKIKGVLSKLQVINKEKEDSATLEETIGIIHMLSSQIENGEHLHPVMRLIDPKCKISNYDAIESPFDMPQHKARMTMLYMIQYLQKRPNCTENEFIISLQEEAKRLKTGKIFSKCFELRLALFFAADYIRYGIKEE